MTLKMLLARTKSHGITGLQPFAGSRTSLLVSMEAMPPSVRAAPGAPPFTLVWSMSMPSSYSLVVPFWGVFFQTSAQQWAPHGVFDSLAETQSAHFPLARVAAVLGPIPITFLIYWFAAVVVWMWAREFRTRKIAAGAGAFVAVCALVFVYVYSPWVDHATATGVIAAGPELSW